MTKKCYTKNKGKNIAYWPCPNKIATFHSCIRSEGGFQVGYDGQSERRDLKNLMKKHIGQGVREIHGVW
jgi:hypothetical protein